MVAGRAQLQGVGRRPVDERIRGWIQGGGTGRGVGPQQARRTLWKESEASGCTRRKKSKAKKAREIGEDRTQRADAIRPEAGSVCPEKKVFLLMHGSSCRWHLYFLLVTGITGVNLENLTVKTTRQSLARISARVRPPLKYNLNISKL